MPEDAVVASDATAQEFSHPASSSGLLNSSVQFGNLSFVFSYIQKQS